MANLTTFTFNQLVSQVATSIQGASSSLLDFTVGSVLRALAEAVSAIVLWLQAIILQVLTLTRALTSVGPDLDSWMADYGVTREPAVMATGSITFSRFTTTQQAVVPIGATVQTTDSTQTFVVTLDTGNTAYNAGLGGYVIAANTASVAVPVQCANAGTAGNVQANSITVVTTPITGVDTVTNGSAFTNGLDQETDNALRWRFVLYLASLSKATKTAIASAIAGTRQGLQYTLTENEQYDGTEDIGFFYVVIDNGSGTPSDDLIAAVYAAVDAVRALTIRFAVFAPAIETANVAMTITSAAGYTHANIVAAVGSALRNFINALPLGTSLPFTQLAAVAYGVAGVANVYSIQLNSGGADLTANQKQTIKAGTITVN